MKAKDYAKRLIELNRITEALAFLKSVFGDSDPDIEKQISLRSANFNQLKADIENGTLSKDQEKLSLNQINHSLLQMASAIPDDLQTSLDPRVVQKLNWRFFAVKNFKWLAAGIWFLPASACLVLLTIPKQGVEIQMTVQSSSLLFNAMDGVDLNLNTPVSRASIDNFERFDIPVPGFTLIDQDGSHRPVKVAQGRSLIAAPLEDGGPNLLIKNPDFQNLQFEGERKVKIEIPENLEAGKNSITFIIDPGNVSGIFSVQDSLYIQCSNVTLKNTLTEDGADLELELGEIIVNPLPEAIPVQFKSGPDLFFFNIEPTAGSSTLIEEQNFRVDELDFTRAEMAGKIKSGIRAGKVAFLNKKGNPFGEVEVGEYEYLCPVDYESLQVVSLNLSIREIEIRLTGKVGHIKKGAGLDSMKSQNPGYVIWLFFNHPIIIIAMALIGFGLTFLLNIYARKQLR